MTKKTAFIVQFSLVLLIFFGCQSPREKNNSNLSQDSTSATAPTIDSVELSQYFPDSLLHRFQGEIDAFASADSLHPPQPGSALFVGSSSLRMWSDSLQADMAPIPVIDRGFGGSTLPEVLYYFNQLVIPYHPKVVLLYEGENDLAMEGAGITPEQVKETFEIFVNTVKAKLPETEKIYFISIKPSIARWNLWPQMKEANQLIRDYANSQDDVYFVDVADKMMDGDEVKKDIFIEDNLHMNRKGYGLWTETIKPELSKDFKENQ